MSLKDQVELIVEELNSHFLEEFSIEERETLKKLLTIIIHK